MATRSFVKLCWASLLLAPLVASSDPVPTDVPRPNLRPEGHEPEPEVEPWSAYEHVNAEEFNKALKERDYNLVAFTDPNIFDSEMLEWQWPFIKEQLPNHYLSVNCTAEVDLCLEHDVRTYPSVRLYRRGTMYARYRGPRNGGEIVKFTQRSLRHVVGSLDETTVGTFPESDDVTFILHLRPEDANRGVYRRFHDLATEFSDRYSFAIVGRDQDNSIDEEGEDAPTVMRCYNNVDKRQAEFDAFFENIDGMRNFVKNCGERLVKTMTMPNAQGFIEGKRAVLYYFDADQESRAKFAKDILDVAKQFQDQLDIVVSNPLQFGDIVTEVGLPNRDFPSMALQNPATMQMMLYTNEDRSPEVIARFINDGLTGQHSMVPIQEMNLDGQGPFGDLGEGGEEQQEGQEGGQEGGQGEEQAAPRDEL